jgi:excinuclease ABC subunit C
LWLYIDCMTDTDTTAPLKGPARIAAYLKTLPDGPGVYRMMSDKGDVLYVGKAKSLKKRVASYTKGGHNERIARMIAETAEMLFVTTASEIEALLLESNLIKRLKPRYNVSYRDDKSFPNILLREDHAFPQLLKHRGAKSDQGRLFRAVRQRRRRQPHAQHAAARLPAALLFGFGVRIAHASLPAVPDQALQRALHAAASTGPAMRSWCAKPSFSSPARAARCRIIWCGHERGVRGAGFRARRAAARPHPRDEPHPVEPGHQSDTFAEADVFAAHNQGGETCIQVFFFRAGQNWGNRPYFPRHPRELSTAEVLESFVAQFYDERPAPALILLSEDIPNRECWPRR